MLVLVDHHGPVIAGSGHVEDVAVVVAAVGDSRDVDLAVALR